MRLYGNTPVPSNRAPTLAVLALLLGAGLWGIVWYPMRLLENAGLHGVWLTLILYGTALIASLPWTFRTFRAFTGTPVGITVLALASGWTNVAFVLAVLEGNIVRVMLLFYLSPLWAVLMARLVLREHMSRASMISLGVAMFGAVAMLWDSETGFPWPQGSADWYALSAGFAFALANVTVRKLDGLSIAAKAMSAWVGVVLVAVAILLVAQLAWTPVSTATLAGAAGLGVGAILLMTVLVQYGVSYLPVQQSAVIMLFELVVGAVSQQLLTDEAMGVREWFGGALIIGAAYVSARNSAA